MRNTPVIIFINKLDREGKHAFELLDEIEEKLDLKLTPLSWPISMGHDFKGVYDLYENKLNLFKAVNRQVISEIVEFNDINSPELDMYITPYAQNLREDVELIRSVYPAFSEDEYRNGNICPVFFGSALNNFGVKELLDCFIKIAPYPQPSPTLQRKVSPEEEKFTGFVFKIHANMDPNHRDRIAFVRVCSGIFKRNTNYLHVRNGKQMKFSNPTSFMAEKKSIIDEAFPGDIIGIHDTGNFKIADSLTEGEKLNFTGIPSFSPEFFRYVENADPLKSKQLAKGLEQLMDEGVAQLFSSIQSNRKIIGTVGQLQFDVIQFRLLHEYSASCRYEPIDLYKACWITSNNKAQLNDFKSRKQEYMAIDKYKRDVFLAYSSYALTTAQEKFPDITFHFTSEF